MKQAPTLSGDNVTQIVLKIAKSKLHIKVAGFEEKTVLSLANKKATQVDDGLNAETNQIDKTAQIRSLGTPRAPKPRRDDGRRDE